MSKNIAAAELGRKGGLKGGVVRASRLTPAQRSASARKAVQARWAKAGKPPIPVPLAPAHVDESDARLIALLTRLRETTDLEEVHRLSLQIERVVFHKQFANA